VSVLAQKVNASRELAAIPLRTAEVRPIAVGSMPATCWTVAAVAVGAFAAGYVYGEVVD
jgi:hypothetical protein